MNAYRSLRFTLWNGKLSRLWVVGLSLAAGVVWADELPLRIELANDTTADYRAEPAAVVLWQDAAQDLPLADEAALAAWTERTFGAEFTLVHDSKALIPSAIISRFSIVQHGVWQHAAPAEPDGSGRSLWAHIDLPGKTDLWVINTRLAIDADWRYEQTKDLLEWIFTAVPEQDYLLLGGDLNITDSKDPSLELLGEVLEVDGPRLIKQPDGELYDWLLSDADLALHLEADEPDSKSLLQKASLDVDAIRQEVYRQIKAYRILDLADIFQPPPPVTLENGINVEGTVSPILFRNHHEYRFTPLGPGTRSLDVVMESTGAGDADLQLAYWDFGRNRWIFYASQATPGTSNERVSISNSGLLNRAWRIIVEYSAGTTAPYRLRAFEVIDMQAHYSILHPVPPLGFSPPQADLSALWQTAPAGGWRFYALEVPINAAELLLEVERTSAGIAHVYVRQSAPPWFNDYVLTAQSNAVLHTLPINANSTPPLSAGVWYFGVYAPGPQDTDFELRTTLSCCVGPPPVNTDINLVNTLPQAGAVWFGDWQYYVLDIPLNATSLNLTTNGTGPGDVDLYYGGSQRPTLTSANNRRWGSSQEQMIRSLGGSGLPTSSPYPAHIGVYGYSAGGYELTAGWNDTLFTQTLPNGNREFLLQNFSVYDSQPLHFAIQVPGTPAYSSLDITVLSADDAMLLVRQDAPPDKYTYDVSLSTLNGSSVLLTGATVPALTPGTWWFALYSNETRSDVTALRAVLQP